MRAKNWALFFLLFAGTAFAKSQCTGDCQAGTIAGPYTSPQVAEFTTTRPFPICDSASCTSGSWNGDQIEGIDAMQNIGTKYQFYDDSDRKSVV